MMDAHDRKMFAPLRNRESITPEAKLVTVLSGYQGGAIAAELAERIVHAGLATGTRRRIIERIGEMLDSLEEAGKVERTPDGRYRTTATRR